MRTKSTVAGLLSASLLLTACNGTGDDSSRKVPVVSVSLTSNQNTSPPASDVAETSANSSETSSGNSETSSGNSEMSANNSETTSSEETPTREPISGEGVFSGAELILDSGRSIFLATTNSENGANYARSVNAYKEKFPDLNIYSLIIPTAISFYLPDKYKEYDPDEKGHIDEINAQLKDVTPVDVYSVLARHTNEPIYFNTDHHWTQLGAFYGAEEFAKTANVDFKPISEFEKMNAGEFVGSAYGNSGEDPRVLELAEDFIYYVPKSDYSTLFYDLDGTGEFSFSYFENPDEFDKFGMYSLYMYGDLHIVKLNTSCKNGRRLLIIKEAFANPFACNLVNSFEEIVIADMKYIETTATQLIKDHNITDLLFCLSTLSTSGTNQNYISEIM